MPDSYPPRPLRGQGISTSDEKVVGAILAIARDVLSAPALGADDDLADHGATSLSLTRIIAEAHQALGLDIDGRDLPTRITVCELAKAA